MTNDTESGFDSLPSMADNIDSPLPYGRATTFLKLPNPLSNNIHIEGSSRLRLRLRRRLRLSCLSFSLSLYRILLIPKIQYLLGWG